MKININRVLSASDHWRFFLGTLVFPFISWKVWNWRLYSFSKVRSFFFFFCFVLFISLICIPKLSSLSPSPPLPFLSVTLLCHLSFTSYNIQYITSITCHCQANSRPITGHENSIAQPKAHKCPTSTSHFSPFNCCLSALLLHLIFHHVIVV